jgi:MscS family membrane protein
MIEAENTSPVTASTRTDLDVVRYMPDWLQPAWDFLSPYPGLLTILLIMTAYVLGRFLRFLLSKVLNRLADITNNESDNHLVEYLTRPIVLTTVILALMLAVSAFELPTGLHDATLSMLATILLLSWMRAGLRTARIVLELVGSHHHRIEIIQEKTIPLFNMGLKMLVVGFGAYIFLLIWGVNPTAWLASAGVIGIAVGFAARDSLANLFSGIFLVADSPYKIGDYIVLDTGERGEVTQMGMRSTRLLTRDDVEVTIPNAVMANAKIVNESGGPWEKERIRVPVGVAYGSDVDEVCEVLHAVAVRHSEIVKQPAPRVRMRAFGSSSLDFELLAWIDRPVLRGRIRHDLLKDIYNAFIEHGIEIPFPQTDVHLRSMPEKSEPLEERKE